MVHAVILHAKRITQPQDILWSKPFWQVSESQICCRKVKTNLVGRVKEAANYFYIESAIALVLSWLINTFVLSVFAKGFYGTKGEDVGLENAGQYLGDTFGSGMKYIWAIGLLAAGRYNLHASASASLACFLESRAWLIKLRNAWTTFEIPKSFLLALLRLATWRLTRHTWWRLWSWKHDCDWGK